MAYHDDLLTQASRLVNLPSPNQADLRRAFSAAYYAVFHLLISEAVAHWDIEPSRAGLARMFEHPVMKRVSKRVTNPKESPYRGSDPSVVGRLRQVAEAFALLQEKRHTADYDNSTRWTESEAREEIDRSGEAFAAWQSIRHEKIAQDYLVSLLIKPRD